MGKRTVKVPLSVISANESSHGIRTRSRRTPPSGGGKENGTPVESSSRRGVHSASSTPKEHHVETTRSSSEHHQQETISKKRARVAAPTGSSRSRLSQGETDSRREEDSIVGAQSGAPVLASKGFSQDDVDRIKNLQIAPNTENCSISGDSKQSGAANADNCYIFGDSKQSGAAVRIAVEHDPFSRRRGEHRCGSCSLDQETVPVEAAVTARALVPTETGPLENQRPGRRDNVLSHTPSQSGTNVSTKASGRKGVVDGPSQNGSIPPDACGTARALVPTETGSLENQRPGRRHNVLSHTPSQSGNIVSTKANGRKVVVDGPIQNGSIPPDACGTSRVAAKKVDSRDQHKSVESTRFGKTADLEATYVRGIDAWQDAYNKLYKKYQLLKTRQVVDAEGAFDAQSRRTEKFATAAEDHVQSLRTTIAKYEEDMRNRARLIQVAHIDWQKDLDIQRAKNLELRQELEKSQLFGNKLMQELEKTQLFGNKLMHDLLQNLTPLSISNYGKSEIIFSHDETGFEFKLEKNKVSEEVGGKDALLYEVVAPGALLHVAPEWMLSEIVFDIGQVNVFFRRVLAGAVCHRS